MKLYASDANKAIFDLVFTITNLAIVESKQRKIVWSLTATDSEPLLDYKFIAD